MEPATWTLVLLVETMAHLVVMVVTAQVVVVLHWQEHSMGLSGLPLMVSLESLDQMALAVVVVVLDLVEKPKVHVVRITLGDLVAAAVPVVALVMVVSLEMVADHPSQYL